MTTTAARLSATADTVDSAAAWDRAAAGFRSWLLEHDRAPATVDTYTRDLRRLAAGVAPATPWDLTPDHLRRWLDGHGWAPSTYGRMLASVGAFYDWAHHTGHRETSPATGIQPPATHAPGSSAPAAWVDPMAAFATWLTWTGRSAHTCNGYLLHVRRLADAHPLTSPWDLTRHQVETWLDRQGWARSTRGRVLTSLRHFYTWATTTGACRWSPVAGVQLPDARRPGPARRDLSPAWDAALSDYLQTLRAGARTPATVENMRLRLTNLARYSADPWTVTTPQLLDWLSTPRWAPATKRGACVAVTGFYRWAVRAGHIARSPADDLPTVRVPRALPRPMPTDVLRSALDGADDRARLALMLGAYAGLRRSEIASVHYSRINRGPTGTVLHVVGKGGHHRRVPLVPDLADALNAERLRRAAGRPGAGFPRTATATGYLFPGTDPDRPLRPASLAVIVGAHLPDGWTMHTLRHRFATSAYAADRDLRAVQELLGHTKPETTARYAAVPQDALARALANVTL